MHRVCAPESRAQSGGRPLGAARGSVRASCGRRCREGECIWICAYPDIRICVYHAPRPHHAWSAAPPQGARRASHPILTFPSCVPDASGVGWWPSATGWPGRRIASRGRPPRRIARGQGRGAGLAPDSGSLRGCPQSSSSSSSDRRPNRKSTCLGVTSPARQRTAAEGPSAWLAGRFAWASEARGCRIDEDDDDDDDKEDLPLWRVMLARSAPIDPRDDSGTIRCS